jgi:hypothetical protein
MNCPHFRPMTYNRHRSYFASELPAAILKRRQCISQGEESDGCQPR